MRLVSQPPSKGEPKNSLAGQTNRVNDTTTSPRPVRADQRAHVWSFIYRLATAYDRHDLLRINRRTSRGGGEREPVGGGVGEGVGAGGGGGGEGGGCPIAFSRFV